MIEETLMKLTAAVEQLAAQLAAQNGAPRLAFSSAPSLDANQTFAISPPPPVQPTSAPTLAPKALTVEDIKNRLIHLERVRKIPRDDLLAVLKGYDAKSLHDLEKSDYPKIMAELNALESAK
ncbi:hypothetical protein CCP4SC76_1640008 [Gammaproteobacteria bacterium]